MIKLLLLAINQGLAATPNAQKEPAAVTVPAPKSKSKRRAKRSKKKKGPVRMERTGVRTIDDFFGSAQSIENTLYNTTFNLNRSQEKLFLALEIDQREGLDAAKQKLAKLNLKIRFDKKSGLSVESSLPPRQADELADAIIALFILTKDLVKDVPVLVNDVRKLSSAVKDMQQLFKTELQVSLFAGDLSPFEAVKAFDALRKNTVQVPQMLITAVSLSRELRKTVSFLQFLLSDNKDALAELQTESKKKADAPGDSCQCAEDFAPLELPDTQATVTKGVAAAPAPDATRISKASKERAYNDRLYKGFGGVSIGPQSYKNFALENNGTKLLDGRETLNNEWIKGTVVTSFYYTQVAKSNVYIGYSVGAMFSDNVFYSKNPGLLMNPYCPAYDASVTSVNGGLPGGDQNQFRAPEGTYEYDGAIYDYSCQEHFGVRVNRETLAHIPAEVNTAYVIRPIKQLMLWAAAGISVSWYDYRYTFNQSGYSSLYDSWYREPGQSLKDATYNMYWNYAYEERFGASKTLEEEGINGVKDSYLVGAQASLGAEYIFGELPRIGGEWGFGVIGKYSYIRGTKQPVEPFADMDYEVIDSSDVGWYWDVDQTEITPNLSNFNVSGTLVWHY